MLPIIVQKEHLIEPYTSDDKRACPSQASGGTGFKVTSLNEALEEQFDGFASISREGLLPGVWGGRQLLGVSNQPPCWA